MNILRFIMYLFYRYYSTGGTRNIPYFSALCAVVFLIYIHIFQALVVFNKVYILTLDQGDVRLVKYGKLAFFLLPIFLIVYYLAKPIDIKQLHYSEKKIKKGNLYLVIYIITSFILLFVLIFTIPKKG